MQLGYTRSLIPCHTILFLAFVCLFVCLRRSSKNIWSVKLTRSPAFGESYCCGRQSELRSFGWHGLDPIYEAQNKSLFLLRSVWFHDEGLSCIFIVILDIKICHNNSKPQLIRSLFRCLTCVDPGWGRWNSKLTVPLDAVTFLLQILVYKQSHHFLDAIIEVEWKKTSSVLHHHSIIVTPETFAPFWFVHLVR